MIATTLGHPLSTPRRRLAAMAAKAVAAAAVLGLAAGCQPAARAAGGAAAPAAAAPPSPQPPPAQANAQPQPQNQPPTPTPAKARVTLADYAEDAAAIEAVFSDDGRVLATLHQRADAAYLGVWDVTDPDAPAITRRELGAKAGLRKNLILSPDGQRITLRHGAADELALIHLSGHKALQPLKLGFPREQMIAGAFSPDGRTLAAARRYFGRGTRHHHAIHLVDTATGAVTATTELGYERDIGWMRYSPDGRLLLVGVEKFMMQFRGNDIYHEPRGKGAMLFDARNLTLVTDFGLAEYSSRYSLVRGGVVLPGANAVALLEKRRLAVVAQPNPVELIGQALGADNVIAHVGHVAVAEGDILGMILSKEDESSSFLWIGIVDGDTTRFLRNHDLGMERPLALGVGHGGAWLVATARGLRRFPALPPGAGRAARLLEEAKEMVKAGFGEEAYERIAEALDADWRAVRRTGADVLAPHAPALAGGLELKRWRLMRAEGDPDAVWPLFGFGYMAVRAGHPGVVAQAAGELRRAGRLGEALAGYLDALVLAARGDVDGGYRRAVAARGGLEGDDFGTLAGRVTAHAAAWQPLFADPAKLAFVIGAEVGDLPEAPPRTTAMAPYIDIDGNPLAVGGAPVPAATPAPAPAPPASAPAPTPAPAPAPSGGPVVLD